MHYLVEGEKRNFRKSHKNPRPELDPNTVVGVHTPELRKLAKEIGENEEFLRSLPHEYYEENQLHAIILTGMKDFDVCISRLDEFLPYVDNWATTDIMTVKLFKKRTAELLPNIRRWLGSGDTYIVRYAVGCLMNFYLDDKFDPEYLEMVSAVKCDEYYISMMVAWYFATALAKQYDATIPYIEQRRLDSATHRRAIQKSIESFRITDDQKKYLRTLK